MPYNPFENIVIHQVDTPEPDPFSKVEIAMILNTETDLDIQNLLPCLFWTGLSMSEQIPIAWEDIDLEKGTIQISRSYVRGIYRVTKIDAENGKLNYWSRQLRLSKTISNHR